MKAGHLSFARLPVVRRARALHILVSSYVKVPERPDRFYRAVFAGLRAGSGPAGALATGAARYPNAPALIDEAGVVTYRELQRRSRALEAELRRLGAGPGVAVGIMCRNHRGFVTSLIAAATTGADVVLLNTAFAAPELKNAVRSERVKILVHDDEFTGAATRSGAEVTLDETRMFCGRIVPEKRDDPSKESPALASAGRPSLGGKKRSGRIIVLTSGTTGRAKGAARDPSGAVESAAAILDRIPLRVRDTQVVAAPLFHAWGLLHLLLGLSRAATTVLHRRFDPAVTLDAVAEHRARVLVVVPVMMQRILDLGPDALVEADVSSLAVIASSGSALPAPLATEVLHRFGPVLYNIYGSTEVALATIATPQDLLHEPGTAGRVALGSRVKITGPDGEWLPQGETGRIFVGNSLQFEGYTSGEDKERLHGLVSSGDLGHFDAEGRLFIDGREDDMIVSGGENVFPAEIEDLLLAHPDVADAAVIGVPDPEFGQTLAAFVVRRPGAKLSADGIKDHVRSSLARYKVPRRVEFVPELPRTATGKVLKRKLVKA